MSSEKTESKSPKHRRIPSKLKRLAEIRARAAGEIEIHLDAHRDVVSAYERLKQKLSLVEAKLEASEKYRLELAEKLAAIDADIRKIAPGLKPSSIGAIRASKGKYHAHGTLRQFLLSVLTECAPEYVPTFELTTLAIVVFSLKFGNSALRKSWASRSLFGALYKLQNDGLIEKGPMQKKPKSGPSNTWRIKTETSIRLSDL